MKYARENENGIYQPAIAMLCQVDHLLYKKPILCRITMTFDYNIPKNTHISSLKFDPDWSCYHRTLTHRKQEEEVEDYIRNGKYQFDFPTLPSQRCEINFPEELIKRKFPNGSYIDSVEGSVITVRDPKNDSGNVKCILQLFVVK